MQEFAIEWIKGNTEATVTTPSSTALCNKLKRLHEECPEEVMYWIENKDGSICCHIPVKWVKINRPHRLSDEQRKANAERLKRMRAQKGVKTL